MKYPRTPHLPWSPGGTSDDKRMLDVGPLLGDVVITEKMDGSNVALSRENFFARSHAQVPVHRSFDLGKALHARLRRSIEEGVTVFCEYCYAVHSIEYYELSRPPMYVFGVEREGVWCSWSAVEGVAASLGLLSVPVLFKGYVESASELEALTAELGEGSSFYGGSREGIVVRVADSFRDFRTSVAKWVRKDHVQTDVHWSHQAIRKQNMA
jgi:hypothetical protein